MKVQYTCTVCTEYNIYILHIIKECLEIETFITGTFFEDYNLYISSSNGKPGK